MTVVSRFILSDSERVNINQRLTAANKGATHIRVSASSVINLHY